MRPDRWRLALVLPLLLGPSAWAAKPRVAAQPLELVEVEPAHSEQLQAIYAVLLARSTGIRLASTDVTETPRARQALSADCPSDACTRAFAEATQSLYGLFAELRRDPFSLRWELIGRVVRRDGALVRSVRVSRPIDAALVESGRAALTELVEQLELDTLPPELSDASAGAPLIATLGAGSSPSPESAAAVVVRAPAAASTSSASPTRVGGAVATGVGAATLLTGGALAVVSAVQRANLNLDAQGDVPSSKAPQAAHVVDQSRAATVLLPTGAVIAAAGLTLLLWPSSAPVKVGLAPDAQGGALVFGGRLP